MVNTVVGVWEVGVDVKAVRPPSMIEVAAAEALTMRVCQY
jgi:hypothetical protein